MLERFFRTLPNIFSAGVSDYIWLRVFSQDPESYVWVFMCIWWDNTSHDYDSCVSSHMELLIPDLRAKQPDAVDVEAAIRDWSGSITSDDSRYIGHTVSPVSVIWEENNPDLGTKCVRKYSRCIRKLSRFRFNVC